MILRASNRAFMPALAVQREITRLTRKLTPSVVRPCEASRVISSRSTSMAPPGAMLAIVSRRLATLAGSANSPSTEISAAIPGKNREQCVKRDTGGNQQNSVFRNASVDTEKDILPPPSRDLRRRFGRAPSPGSAFFAAASLRACIAGVTPREPDCHQKGAQNNSP